MNNIVIPCICIGRVNEMRANGVNTKGLTSYIRSQRRKTGKSLQRSQERSIVANYRSYLVIHFVQFGFSIILARMGYDFVGEILTEPIEESVGIESI